MTKKTTETEESARRRRAQKVTSDLFDAANYALGKLEAHLRPCDDAVDAALEDARIALTALGERLGVFGG